MEWLQVTRNECFWAVRFNGEGGMAQRKYKARPICPVRLSVAFASRLLHCFTSAGLFAAGRARGGIYN